MYVRYRRRVLKIDPCGLRPVDPERSIFGPFPYERNAQYSLYWALSSFRKVQFSITAKFRPARERPKNTQSWSLRRRNCSQPLLHPVPQSSLAGEKSRERSRQVFAPGLGTTTTSRPSFIDIPSFFLQHFGFHENPV